MSWRTTSVREERERLVEAYLGKRYSKSELAERFGITRPTVDLWIRRFEAEGKSGLNDRSRAPRSCPHRTGEAIEELIVETRRAHPSWGPEQLRGRLKLEHEALELPALSTVAAILKRHGLVEGHRRGRRRRVSMHRKLQTSQSNQVWSIDFKGQFRLGNRQYCYPLTMTDSFARYVLCCHGLPSVSAKGVRQQMQQVFEQYGLPAAIRSDNGQPFAGSGLWRLTRLNVWWMSLGIDVIRTRPGKPQDNGQHERMHRTLKADTTRPPSGSFSAQQRRFDLWRQEFNDERPHQGIGGQRPSHLYQPSCRAMPSEIAAPEYPGHYEVRSVRPNGAMKFKGKLVFVSEALSNQRIGLEEIAEDVWRIMYYRVLLGHLDSTTNSLAL
jgi:putative transposase